MSQQSFVDILRTAVAVWVVLLITSFTLSWPELRTCLYLVLLWTTGFWYLLNWFENLALSLLITMFIAPLSEPWFVVGPWLYAVSTLTGIGLAIVTNQIRSTR